MAFDGNINNALLLLDSALSQLETGFVLCETCGDQEDTKTLDCVDDLKMVKHELLAFINKK